MVGVHAIQVAAYTDTGKNRFPVLHWSDEVTGVVSLPRDTFTNDV